MIWKPGDEILLRHVWRGEVRYAMPMTVVDDRSDRILLYLQAGTRCKSTDIDFDTGTLSHTHDHIWNRTNVLQIVETDAGHSTELMWSAETGEFLFWYINLQLPALRVPDGLLSWDQSLDIVVSPDLTWSWKDEDHFERIQTLGWLNAAEAHKIRSEGERVIERIENRHPPFNEPWPDWQPDASWPIPALPDNWADIPEAYSA